MQPRRQKPRVNHVRTGCLTCKRRRVKCPEEHPQCSRCIRGGFVCAGYAVPKPWIFESSAEVRRKFEEEGSEPSKASPFVGVDGSAPPLSQPTHTFFDVTLSSPLQLGNSDPFDSCAVPIGPYEAYLFQLYQQLTLPALYNFYQPKWREFVVNEITSNHRICLQDEAAAYSIFARNSALEHVYIRRANPTMSPQLLSYMTKAQAALHRRLALMDGSETHQIVYTIMWTTCFMAGAEMIVRSPTTDFHFNALGKLIVRYVELTGRKLEAGSILILVYVILLRATTTLTRPVLDMSDWFSHICQDTWAAAETLWPMREHDSSAIVIHQEIEDETIREIMTSQRQGSSISPDLIEACDDPEEIKLLANTMRSQELSQNGRMLTVATEALGKLGTADLTLDQVQDESARAYMSISTILWLRLTSVTAFFGNSIFDASFYVLPHLRMVLVDLEERERTHAQTRYRESQLWALFMAVQSEYHRIHVLGTAPVCGEWFMEAFRDHASVMQIRSWQQAVSIFEQFLFNGELKPHISEWWQEVIFDSV